MSSDEKDQLASSAAVVALIRAARNGSIAVNEDFRAPHRQQYVITIQDPLKQIPDSTVDLKIQRISHDQDFQVEITGETNTNNRTLNVASQWPVDSFLFPVNIGDKALVLQYIRNIPHGVCLQFKGTKVSLF